MKQEKLSLIGDGNANVTATLEDRLIISYKFKYIPNIWPSNYIPRYLLKWIKTLFPHKNVCANLNSIIIHNWKRPSCLSIDWWIKKTVVYSCYGILFINERTECSRTQRHGSTLRQIAKWKKLIWKGYEVYNFKPMIFWKGKTLKMVKRSGVSRVSDGWGGAKMDDLVEHMGYFFKAEKLFCMIQ